MKNLPTEPRTPRTLLGTLVPGGVCVAEAFHDDEPAPLYPEEEAAVAGADPGRRREFATARACARRALGELGLPPGPVPRSLSRAPRWPDGVLGSLTHCTGYRGAAVARASAFTSLGIDAERHAPLRAGVLELVAGPAERARLARLAEADPAVAWDRLLCCAKEAAYKAWYPIGGRWLGFLDADADLTEDRADQGLDRRGAFTVVAGGLTFAGRWLAHDGLLLAAVATSSSPVLDREGHRTPG
ncbi:4'-phosphopantetheinyl transferase family protein [Dactylosporangium sp. CA-052675]|uniref:4'-phosphopantetheinyl transferase family protein n=1 Tax=Dactylosporangium sp. CA-052675 TaxID=3239927 RepID=UPI003D900684